MVDPSFFRHGHEGTNSIHRRQALAELYMRGFESTATDLLNSTESALDNFDDSPTSDHAFNVLACFNNAVRHWLCTLDAPADDEDFEAAVTLACDKFERFARELTEVWGELSAGPHITHDATLGATLASMLLQCRTLLLNATY